MAPDQPSASVAGLGCLNVTITEIIRTNNLAGRSFSVSTPGTLRGQNPSQQQGKGQEKALGPPRILSQQPLNA